MRSDIIVIGGGASGLMAAYSAARALVERGDSSQVTVLEKMPRPARKVMITGKGRCNFTNLKDWESFSAHIRTKTNFVKSAFFSFDSKASVDFFESLGVKTIVERGDRAYPASQRAADIVDALVRGAQQFGVKLETECEVKEISRAREGFRLECADGREWLCKRLIIATGGLSYPLTGSSGDGLRWAGELGHSLKPCFPSLTALVPEGYKTGETISRGKGHIDRSTPLSEFGRSLCGIQLKNVVLSSIIDGIEVQEESGDVDFTDGGIEGPLGFMLSRRCVKAMINGSRVSLRLDLKPGVDPAELRQRVFTLWEEVYDDGRSKKLKEKEKCRILLGKLMPWDLIPAFLAAHPRILRTEHPGRRETRVIADPEAIAVALQAWDFKIAGFVGYERCVVTAGGVDTDGIIAKTMASRVVEGLYFCGEVMDVDADTGGYNLQAAFSTGFLAGRSAALSICRI